MEQIECEICGGFNKPNTICDNFICPNYEQKRLYNKMKHDDTYDMHTCHDNCQRISCVLRRELTAVTEQRDGIEAKLRIALHGHPNSELWGDAGLIAATMRCVDAVEKLTVQRDEALSDLEFRRELYKLQTINYENVCEQRDGMQSGIEYATEQLVTMTEQRNRLAEALRKLCEALLTGNPRDITELLNKAGDALQFTTNPNEL
jgi:hypothetical protein